MPDSPRILLVDDEPDVRAVLSRLLAHHGINDVVEAADAEDALAHAATNRFDVVLADQQLAGDLHGLDILVWMRDHQPAALRVLITGDIAPAAAQAALADGVLDFCFQKPWNNQDLLAILGIDDAGPAPFPPRSLSPGLRPGPATEGHA